MGGAFDTTRKALLDVLDLNIDFIVIFFNNQRVDNN